MKKLCIVILSVLLLLAVLTACGAVKVDYNKELVTNGTFESDLEGWTRLSSSDESTPSIEKASENSDTYKVVGAGYVSVNASKYNTYTQTVAIEKDSVYLLSAKVKVTSSVSSDDTLGGAFIAIDSDYTSTAKVVKSGDDWQELKCYFNSGDRESVVVRFGVGTASYTASGTAAFDAVSLMKVEPVSGTVIVDLSKASADAATFSSSYRNNSSGTLFMTLTVVLGAVVLFALYAALRRLMAGKGALLSPDVQPTNVGFFKSAAFMLIVCELAAFAVRLISINFIYGGVTLGDYVGEATKLADVGAQSFYHDNVSTTPIGSLYLLWMLGSVAKPLNLVSGTIGFSIFLKIPAVLADLVAVFVIYYLANRKYNQYISALFAGAYAVLPIFFFMSAGWGAYSSIGALFILLSLSALLDRKYVWSIIYFALSLLFMTEAMLLIPLFLAYIVYAFIKRSDDEKMAISITFTSSLIVLYLLSLPFAMSFFTEGKPFIALTRYIDAFLAHAGFTENAFSVYGLFGLGSTAANTASYVFNGIFAAVGILYTICLFFRSKSRLDLMFLSAFTFALIFVMTSAVDTLLLYPALILLLVYGMLTGDRRVLKLFGAFAVTTLINTSYAMAIGGYFGTAENSAQVFMTAGDPVLIVFSIANVLLFGYFAYLTYSICVKEDVKGVVIIEKNYFRYALDVMKECCGKVAVFFKETLPAIFKKKEGAENDIESK